jgi:hypothetical protein
MIESSIIHHVLWFPRANSHFFGVTGKKRTMFLVLALDLALDDTRSDTRTLVPTLRIAQKWKASWRLWNWRPVLGESGTWVLFVLIPSSY